MLDDDSERESATTLTAVFLFSSLIARFTGETVACFSTAGILESARGTSGALTIINEIFESVKDLVDYF